MPDRPIVFVVDDDAGIRQWLKSLLEDADYSVRSFATGRAFIDAFRDTESGCLIADVRLPDMSGLELQSWLSARGAPVPVIIVTGYGDVTVAVQSMQGGAVDFIEKPASNITILDAVRRALARAAALRGDNSSATEAADAEARLRLLSPREREVVKAFVRGRTNDAIADALGIDLRAVELHRARAMEKLGATGPSHLLRLTLAGNIDVLELDVQPVTATDLDLLLQGFTHAARAAAAAELAAVAIFDDGPARADRFFVSGLALDNRALHQALSRTATLTALAAARRPRRLRRLAGDPQLIEFPPDFPAVHAVLLIPLATRKRAYGWLALLNKRAQDGFDDEDEQVGLGLANQVARTLELNAELQARIDQQRAIAHLSAMALVGGDLQGLFDQTVRLVAQTIGVAYCSILELNGTREEMTARAGVGWPNGIAGEATVPGGPGSLIGAALAATEPIVFLDLAAETRFQVGPILKRCGVVSGFTVNIPGMARPYGTLGAYTDKPRNFSADEIEFVRTLANVVGQAVARKQTEESLSRMQKMEAIGLLTGGIAHDFNNLLTVVLGNAQLAATMTEEGSELHAINAEIEAAARRGADLTHRLLAFSRRQPLRPATLDPARLVSGMRSLLARALDANVEIEVLADDAAGLVHADATQLESALLNLAINARDAMPTGGRLVIDVRNAEIGEAFAAADPELKAGPYVVVSVSDTGTGMPPEVANRAFEPFSPPRRLARAAVSASAWCTVSPASPAAASNSTARPATAPRCASICRAPRRRSPSRRRPIVRSSRYPTAAKPSWSSKTTTRCATTSCASCGGSVIA
jgi:FixJ family two-component response regulator/signal transduction histidine kinase